MSAASRGRVLAAALAIPLLLGAVGCGEKDKEQAKAAAASPCPSTVSGTASTPLPGDLPAPPSASGPYQYGTQGKTRVWFFAVDGSPDRLPSLRDGYDAQLKAKGYSIEGTDQEKGAEAESEFKGPHAGTTNFRPLCTGKVVLRLKLTS